VERARWTVETFRQKDEEPIAAFKRMLPEAQGVAVFPGTVKAGFVLGAEYGDGVLVARLPSGQWSAPAFYTMGAGSIGLQAGGEVAEIILLMRSQEAVQAVVKHQGKLGADLELTVATMGAGVEGSTTTNVGADIIAFSQAAGLFAGGPLEGAVLAKRNDYNAAFYGAGATPEAILFEGRFSSPKAETLRAALSQ
jgi:lipid-binding SYLF domain-containing protein